MHPSAYSCEQDFFSCFWPHIRSQAKECMCDSRSQITHLPLAPVSRRSPSITSSPVLLNQSVPRPESDRRNNTLTASSFYADTHSFLSHPSLPRTRSKYGMSLLSVTSLIPFTRFQNRRTKWKRKFTNELESAAHQYYNSLGLADTRPLVVGDRLWLFTPSLVRNAHHD